MRATQEANKRLVYSRLGDKHRERGASVNIWSDCDWITCLSQRLHHCLLCDAMIWYFQLKFSGIMTWYGKTWSNLFRNVQSWQGRFKTAQTYNSPNGQDMLNFEGPGILRILLHGTVSYIFIYVLFIYIYLFIHSINKNTPETSFATNIVITCFAVIQVSVNCLSWILACFQ